MKPARQSYPQARDSLSTPAATLIERLDGVRECGPGRWIARCPAHQDKRPSLSVRETGDGTLLVKCFAGCGAADVMAAAGLELQDLFPRPLKHDPPRIRDYRHVHAAADALKVLAAETLVVQIAADSLARGNVLDAADLARLAEASIKIREAREAI